MAVLITGSSGFIGTHCTETIKLESDVIGVDIAGSGNCEKLYNIDIRDEEQVARLFSNEKIDSVVHLAGISNYHLCEQNPELAKATNAQGTLNILKHCKNIDNFVLASTAMLYGDAAPALVTEEQPPAPKNVYAATKLLAEKYCCEYAKKYGFGYFCLRATSVYGVGMRKELAIRRFIEQAISGEKITIYGDGTQTRNFLYVTDLVNAILASLWQKNNEKSGCFNIGGPENISINGLIALLRSNTFPRLKLEYLPHPSGDIHSSELSLKKIGQELEFVPKIKIETGLKLSIDWIKEINNGKDNY